MGFFFRKFNDSLIIFGSSNQAKTKLQELGAKFNFQSKAWILSYSEQNELALKSLVKNSSRLEKSDDIDNEDNEAPDEIKISAASEEQTIAKGLTVGQLLAQIKTCIAESFSSPVWIIGEIQNITKKPLGVFFELAEQKENAKSEATVTVKSHIWTNVLKGIVERHGDKNIRDLFSEGIKARLLCNVGLYQDRGYITLSVIDVDPFYTKGNLALAREELLRELRSKGLDETNKSLTVPRFPFKIGLISAEGSRAKSDFIDQLLSYKFPGEIFFYESQMQGDKTVSDVVSGIEFLENKSCDLIVITRGGGSAADLRWFDAAQIAYSVANCSVPIIAAIGHHDDTCVAEIICYQREKTPTAAADFIVSIFEETRNSLIESLDFLSTQLQNSLDDCMMYQKEIEDRLFLSASQKISTAETKILKFLFNINRIFDGVVISLLGKLDHLASNIAVSASSTLASHEQRLLGFLKDLTAKDPKPWLLQGWTRLYGEHGLIKSVSDVNINDNLKTRLIDGILKLTVSEKSKETKND